MKILRHPLFMRPTPESELEQTVDRALRHLPDRRAPNTLIPRVLTAVAARSRRPWWEKSLAFWPWSARLAFFILSTGLGALGLYFTWGLSSGISVTLLADEIATASSGLSTAMSLANTLAGALLALAQTAGPWLLWTTLGVATASYLTTLILGTYCYRLVSRRL
jgi:hypothetical protein